MEKIDLSNNDHGVLAESIVSRLAGYPELLTDIITRHTKDTYSDLIADQADEVKISPGFSGLTEQTPLTDLDGIDLPENGDWGYNKGWKPDNIIRASWKIYDSDKGEYYPVAKEFENRDPNELPHLGLVGSPGNSRPKKGSATVYYLIEVKTVTTGDRVRLTENQHKMMEVVSKEVDFVHPVIVILDINNLPESVEIQVDIYEESTWGTGKKSKNV